MTKSRKKDPPCQGRSAKKKKRKVQDEQIFRLQVSEKLKFWAVT